MAGSAPEKIRAYDRPDRSRIDRAIRVSSDAPVDRAYVEACAASDTVQRLAQDRVGQHRAAAVIENHDVHLARPVEVALAPWSGDETGVGRQLLPGCSAREDFQKVAQVVQPRDDLLDSHHGDERLG